MIIIRTDEIQETCSKILTAVDSSDNTVITETLQLKTKDNTLILSVTNNEYFVETKTSLTGEVSDFDATVEAELFLKLVAQTTTETIELNVTENSLLVRGNGTYKLPLIFNGETLLELPKININNPTMTMNVSSEILNSILQYNSKELQKGCIARPVQKLYYVDEKGCITFTTGACVNNFTLEKPVSILLNAKLVKLFKLFKEGNVSFTLGYDSISDDTIQTKVRFENDSICITSILSCDDSLLRQVPVAGIRARVEDTYENQVNINRSALIQTIDRLLLFIKNSKEIIRPYSKFEFKKDEVIIWDAKRENCESVSYVGGEANSNDYSAIIDLTDLRLTLDGCTESYVTIKYGNGQAVVISRGNVLNVIPEVNGIN